MVLHHDWWFWNNGTTVFGFLPIGLGYQMLISIAAVVPLGLGRLQRLARGVRQAAAGPPASDRPAIDPQGSSPPYKPSVLS